MQLLNGLKRLRLATVLMNGQLCVVWDSGGHE